MKTSRTVLLIGGPGKDVPEECDGLKIVRIGCDMASILGYPGKRRFYDFDAVIYWPDATCRRMPTSAKAWRAHRGVRPLPQIDLAYWSIRAKSDLGFPAIRFSGPADGSERCEDMERGTAPAISQQPRSSADCDRIDGELREMYDDRLRDIVRGTAGGLIAFAIMTDTRPGALSWLSQYITIYNRADTRVCASHDAQASTWIRESAEHIQELPRDKWPLDFTMTWDEPGMEHECPRRAEWRHHWRARDAMDDIRDVADPSMDDIAYKIAVWSFPHVSGMGRGKSILFRTLSAEEAVLPKGDPSNGSCGAVLVMPAPSSLPALLGCVACVLDHRHRIHSNAGAAREPKHDFGKQQDALVIKAAREAGRAAAKEVEERVGRVMSAGFGGVVAKVESVDQKITSNKERLSARAQKAGKKGGRKRNNPDLDPYAVMRAVHARVKGGLGRGAAARAVIRDYGARDQPIDSKPDTLCKQYRTWAKRRTE
jgi:hypothetical protein